VTPLTLRDVLAEPRGALGGSDAALAIAQLLTDLSPMTLDRATRPLIGRDVGLRDLQLPRHELDHRTGKLRRSVGNRPWCG
jgi:hypothetical protein